MDGYGRETVRKRGKLTKKCNGDGRVWRSLGKVAGAAELREEQEWEMERNLGAKSRRGEEEN